MDKKSVTVSALLFLLLISVLPASMLGSSEIEVFGGIEAGSQNQSFDSETSKEDGFMSPAAEDSYDFDEVDKGSDFQWNFNETNEWRDFANASDSVKLVIGINHATPDAYEDLMRLIVENRGELNNTVSIGGEIRAVIADVPLWAESSFVAKVRAAGLSSYIEPNMKFQACFVPNDPYWSLQWGPARIEADYAWNTTIGEPSVLVAVIDTGIDWNHPDLAANYVALGYDWVNNDTDPMDDRGHGTHCAGIIAAVLNNSIGIAGLAQVRIMAEKGLDSGGWGTEDDLANAIAHAVDQGADILSLSWGSYAESALIHEAIKYAYDAGVLVVAAAGNDATSIKHFPAGYDEVIAVSATDEYDNPAGWTNFGDWIELAAPGVSIYSTVWDDSYTYMSGTSMSSPHVAGVASLVWSWFPDMSRDWLRLWLRYTADDLGDPGFDVYYGYGRVNAREAVEQALPDHDLLISNWVRPTYVEPGKLAIVNTTVLNFGASDETDITVQLLVNDSVIDSSLVGFLASGESVTVSCSWSPTVEGMYNLTSYVVPVPDETVTENNVVWAYVYVGFPVKAYVLDSAGTHLGDIITNWQVLNTNWYVYGDTMVYIDYTTLSIEDITYDDVAATGADVLIISCAYAWGFTDSEINAITRYTREGHGLIATAGTLYYGVPNNNKLAPLFGLDETITWYTTSTDLLHLRDPTHPLFFNVPDPYCFPSLVTALPADGRWDENELAGGTYIALGHYNESAIVVNRGLVYISPWLEVIPAYYHFHLQLLYNAITWSSYEKPDHELTVSLDCPPHLKPGESTLLNATVANMGLNNETDVELYLSIDSTIVNSTTISELLTGSSYTINYLWTPTVKAKYNVTAYAPPVLDEEFIANNIDTKMVIVIEIVIENVLVHTDDYAVAPSERYPIVALDNLGVTYTHYSNDPWGFVTALTTQPWDLVVVSHNNYYAFGNNWEELEEYVLNGGLLVLSTFDVDGSHSEPTTLWSTLGVQWVSDMYYPEPVYRWIPTHPIFTFPNTVDDLTSYIEGYWDDGDHVEATTGTPIAGFTTSPATGYAAIVVGNVYRTVLMSFLVSEFRYDEDADGKLDTVELWENAIAYVAVRPDHELVVSLDAPDYLRPGDSSLLNATVHNRGSSNETDVELFLSINNTVVKNATIPKLQVDVSYTLSYNWTTPTVEAVYNVTAYAPPVPGENFTMNNWCTKFTRVTYVVRIGIIETHGETLHTEGLDNYYRSLGHIVEKITTTITLGVLDNYDIIILGEDWGDTPWLSSEIAAVEAFIDSGKGFVTIGDELAPSVQEILGTYGISYTGISAPGGSSSHFDPLHPIMQGVSLIYAGAPVNSLQVTAPAYWIANDVSDTYILIAGAEVGGYVLCLSDDFAAYLYNDDNEIMFKNIVDWMTVKYEHELVVALEAPAFLEPGDSSLLNATVHNRGLSNETDVELQLLIHSRIVDSVVIPELLTGSSYIFTYLWTPLVEGTYNVTAYALPVPGEALTTNNIVSKMVRVRYFPPVALVSDLSQLLPIKPILDSMGVGYDIYNDNNIYLYTEDLDLLLRYRIVIFDNHNRHITTDEHSALQSYLSSGGRLLVTGYDSLGSPSDWLLADVVRSSTIGDNVGEPDLYVVDETHPITCGLYGSFPVGYHITGLYYDCDMAEGYTARNAVTVAELADGYDKVIATELTLGRVVYWNGEGTFDWRTNADCEAMFKNTISWLLDITPPVAEAGPDQTAEVGATVIFDANGSSDDVGIMRYEWDFGDGTNGTGIITTHTYTEPGTYIVTLTVWDVAGNSDADSSTITALLVWVDVYTQKEPFNGKGVNAPCDAFAPQEEVILYAYASHRADPVQNKLVAFQVEDPNGEVWLYRTNSTDENGVATTSFRIPTTPAFGEWTVYVTVDIAEQTANDTLTFQVGWIVEITQVKTIDINGNLKTSFTKDEHIYFNVTVRNIAFTSKEATITIVVYDECGVPIGHVILQDWLIPPGTTQIFIIDLQIPRWTYIGVATIYANAYTDLPTQEGTATCPEKSTTFLITRT